MMTFIPVANLTDTVRALHDEDLEIQMLDAGRALRQCAENYPSLIVPMWRQHEGGLLSYFLSVCKELQRRSIGRGVEWAIRQGWLIAEEASWDIRPLMPRWFGYRPIHDSHASALIRHRPTHYARMWPNVPLDMPTLWPRYSSGQFDFSVGITDKHRQHILDGSMVLPLKEQYLGRVEGWR